MHIPKVQQIVPKMPQKCPKAFKVSKKVHKCPKASKLSKSVQKRQNSPKVSKSVSRGVQNTTKSPKPKILKECFFWDTLYKSQPNISIPTKLKIQNFDQT